MFQLENMMLFSVNAVVCGDVQNSKSDVTTYYNVEIKQIDKTGLSGNKNAVFLYLGQNVKMYLEIKERYLKRKSGSTEECEVKPASCEISAISDPIYLNMQRLVVCENKEIELAISLTGFEYKENKFELNGCQLKKCHFDVKKKMLCSLEWDERDMKNQFVLHQNKNERLIFILNYYIGLLKRQKKLKYEIPVNSLMKNPVFRELSEEEKDEQNENANENESNADFKTKNTNIADRSEISNDIEQNENTNDVHKTEKANVSTNNSMKLSIKIVIGFGIFIIYLCILLCVIILYKKRNKNQKSYTTIETKISYQQV